MHANRRRFTLPGLVPWRWAPIYWLAATLLLAGCSKGVQQIADAVAVLTDKHESLYSQMIDCEQRYANLLEQATDLAAVQQARPQMLAEAKQYRELGDQFLKVEGLTPDKLRGILERSFQRRKTINEKIKQQMDRLTAGGTNNEMRMAIPHLEWSSATLNFAFDADAVANGKKPHKDQLKDQMEAAKARMKASHEGMKSRAEESRARMEEMRSKMRRPDFGPAPATPR